MFRKIVTFANRWRTIVTRLTLWRRIAVGVLLALGGLVAIYLIYCLAFLGRVYPRVSIAGESFGGLTRTQLLNRLGVLVLRAETTPIILTNEGDSTTLQTSTINWVVNKSETANRLLDVGRGTDYWLSFREQIRAPFRRQSVSPLYSYDKPALDRELEKVAGGVDRKAVNASAVFSNHSLVITKEFVGRRVDRDQMEQALISRWLTFSGGEIAIQTEFDLPEVVLSSEEELRSLTDALLAKRLKLTWAGGSKPLGSSEMEQLIEFVGQSPKAPVADGEISQQVLTPMFTQEKVRAYLQQLATTIDKPAQEPKLIIVDGALSVSKASQDGYVVNVDASAVGLLAALEAQTGGEYALTADIQSPSVKESELASLGIKERIGYGETSFAGSPANRKHNISNGVTLLQSALVKPGEEFSTVKTLGKVDDTTGFLPELVIKENKTVPEFGGGLCQVSTTLFRSILNAGLKITERANHSYRVGYYEPPVGLDATIYLPKPDLKFVNDTPGHILIQGQVKGNKVIFELWGTSDGRVSSISDPSVSNLVDPPPQINTETDTLAKGETKQVEKAHQGATALVGYTVTRNGQVINRQSFRSVYKAWPAKFLVGTREDPPPPAP